MSEYEDFPWDDVATATKRLVEEGHTFFQKFTCSGCGQRLTMDVPNTLYVMGGCDKCPASTDIKAQGCNYLLVMKVTPPQKEEQN